MQREGVTCNSRRAHDGLPLSMRSDLQMIFRPSFFEARGCSRPQHSAVNNESQVAKSRGGEFEEAIAMYEAALAVFVALLGHEHPGYSQDTREHGDRVPDTRKAREGSRDLQFGMPFVAASCCCLSFPRSFSSETQ